MDGLKEYFRKTYEEIDVHCELLSGKDNILNAIDEYINNNTINIISLTTRKRNLLEKVIKPSHSHRLFYQSNIPFMVFHS